MRARSDAGSSLIQGGDLLLDGIEQAAGLLLARQPFLRRAAFAEQLFKQHLRIVLHGQRQSGRLPGDGVRVRASITGAAVQAVLFDGQFPSTAAAYPARAFAPQSDRSWFQRGRSLSRDERRSGRQRQNARGRRPHRCRRRQPADAPGCSRRPDGPGISPAACRISVNSKPLPSLAGVHLSMVAPCGT